eukprot:6344441-Amphidinium_carterae.1
MNNYNVHDCSTHNATSCLVTCLLQQNPQGKRHVKETKIESVCCESESATKVITVQTLRKGHLPSKGLAMAHCTKKQESAPPK